MSEQNRFWLQTKAPAGNWVDNLGADLLTCVNHGKWLVRQQLNKPENVRVVKRIDTVIHSFN